MKHRFDPRTRQLMPTGKLSPYEVTAEYNVQRSKIEMVSIWIDETGLKWKVHDEQEGWNLKPMGWPTDIRATYVLGLGQRSSPIAADNLASAVEHFSAQLDADSVIFDPGAIRLLNVCDARC
jgi:hypothetical protein